MNIREEFEKREKDFISPFGCLSAESRGRMKKEPPCPIRTAFQVDRDRIVYSNAFRRLKYKTQVFLAPLGDEYRTRLTHTLEVSEIARIGINAKLQKTGVCGGEKIAEIHSYAGSSIEAPVHSATFGNGDAVAAIE